MSKKKVLIFSYKLPYPLSQGGAIAQFYFLQKLVVLYDITFVTVINNENQKRNLEKLKEKIPSLTIEYYQNPESKKKTFLEKFDKVMLKVQNKIKKVFNIGVKEKAIPMKTDFSDIIDIKVFSFFMNIVNNQFYDLVQFEFYETLALLPIIPVNMKKIVIHHEVRSKRNKLMNLDKSDYDIYLDSYNEIVENGLLSCSDSIFVFNNEDKIYLKNLTVPIYVSPFGIPNELIQKKEASKNFNRFLFIGGEFHNPNKEGLEWFLDTVFIPNCNIITWPIYIIGYWSKNVVDKYSQHKKIIFCGYVSDLSSYYDASVMIVPILSGSGIRTKILTSFANKVPVFSTEFAGEGLLDFEHNILHIFLFNNSTEFLKEFLKMTNEDLISLSIKGFQYYMKSFSEDALINKRIHAIESTLKN
jgi:hypothetical protein